MARYVVGIDLGTSNTAVASAAIPGRGRRASVTLFEVEQLVGSGEVAARPLLPSVRYHPAEGELAPGDRMLPWGATPGGTDPPAIIGELARERGARVPGRLVASAKSWLCHAAVDRTAPVLPWGAEAGIPRVSPLAASASYLAHVAAAWDHAHPAAPLARQEVVLTLPASFDEAARSLTRQAAGLAGLPRVHLLEEPQAAFYDWLYRHGADLAAALAGLRLALVCDVGGGTTDLSLIRVEGDRLSRVAVGDHLMLGGDNMDLGLAHLAEGRLGGGRLSSAGLAQLVQQCRRAKEALLRADGPTTATVTILGGGGALVGGARSVELRRDEAWDLVVEGFFPRVPPGELPRRERGGLVEFGLPYVADPAVTRHVAAFLAEHAGAAREALGDAVPEGDGPVIPDALLLNGGVFRSPVLGERLRSVLEDWRRAPIHLLDNDTPELAVARGAVAYGLARLGRGPRIGGGAARSYFLGLADQGGQRAVCVLPRGTEEGHEVDLAGSTFALRVGRPVRFDAYSSVADTPHTAGDVVAAHADGLHPLPPLALMLPAEAGESAEVPVRLAASLSEVGTLDVHCVSLADPRRRWQLEFELRGAPAGVQVGDPAPALPPRFGAALEAIGRCYGPRSQAVAPQEVRRLRAELERQLGPRAGWDTPLLRELSVPLLEGGARRRRSADHERVWLNLTGYCLRPGFGYPLDDWRVNQLWTLFPQGVQFAPESQVWSEWWTLWRRVAGGVPETAQERLADEIAYWLRPPGPGATPKPPGPRRLAHDDMVRLAGSLERIAPAHKEQLGEWLLARLGRSGEGVHGWWAIGRLGARVPFYGSAHAVVGQDTAGRWLQVLLALDWRKVEPAAFAAVSLARVSGDRERDLPDELREAVAARLLALKAPPAWARMVREPVELDAADTGRVFGESIPAGLRLVNE